MVRKAAWGEGAKGWGGGDQGKTLEEKKLTQVGEKKAGGGGGKRTEISP